MLRVIRPAWTTRLRWWWQGRWRPKWWLQRAGRGWSDADFYEMYHFLTLITADMLEHMAFEGHSWQPLYANSEEEWERLLLELADELREGERKSDSLEEGSEEQLITAWRRVAEIMPTLWD